MSSAASNPSAKAVDKPPLKRNSDDIGWEYGILVSADDLNVIKCKLCPMVVKAGIYRLKLHIAGIKGQARSCPNATDEDIEKCKKAIEDSRKVKKARLLEQQEVRDAVTEDMMDIEDDSRSLDEVGSSEPRAVGPMDRFTMPLDSSPLGPKRNLQQQTISEHVKKERLHKLKRYIARWLYVQGISFNSINCEEFDQLLEAAGRFGPGAKKPYQHELGGKLLQEEVKDTKKLVKDLAQEWVRTGCSVMTDAWTDQKRRSIMNLCVNSCIGTSFVESREASSESHAGEFIFQFVDSFIDKIGEGKIVQVVTDNAANNMAAKELLYIKRPHIFWSSCSTHTINLMLEGIGKMKKFKAIFDSAKELTIFIYAHHKTLSLMRKFTKKREIIRPGVTRFASAFLTVQSLYEKKDQLRMMSQSEEWEKISHVKKSTKGVQATATLVKPSFWNGVRLCLRVFEPLVKVLRKVDGDIKPSMAWLYGEILKAKEEIRMAVGNVDKTGTLYKSVMGIVEEKMKKRLDCPVHMAAYCLNPYFSYNDPSIFHTEEVIDGFIAAVETFYHGDYDKQNQVLNDDFHKFKDKVGHFAKHVAQIGCKDYDFSPGIPQVLFAKHVAQIGCKDYDFSPAKWWANYGTQVPTLQKLAIRILSLTSSASGCERNWSCFDGIHTPKRNRLSCDRVEQLVFVRFNHLHAKKKNKAQKNKKADPLVATGATFAQGWMAQGADEEETDVEPVTGLTWKLISDTCGAEEVTKLRSSARLAVAREVEEPPLFESDEGEINEEDIEFESDQDDVVTTGYEEEGEEDNDG